MMMALMGMTMERKTISRRKTLTPRINANEMGM